MEYARFLEHVTERAGLPTTTASAVVTQTVCHTLGECLAPATARRLADELPDELAAGLREAGHGNRLELQPWLERISHEAKVRMSVALELSAAVAMTLAEAIPEHVAEAVRQELSAPIAHLFQPPPQLHAPSAPRLDPRRHTLAEGQPGSEQPLYAARPNRAQSESVVNAANPHGDTKLSSATGLTQEREEESLAGAHEHVGLDLATGHPPTTRRPVR